MKKGGYERYVVVHRVAGRSVVDCCVAGRNLLHGKGDNLEEEREEEKTRRRTKKDKTYQLLPRLELLRRKRWSHPLSLL